LSFGKPNIIPNCTEINKESKIIWRSTINYQEDIYSMIKPAPADHTSNFKKVGAIPIETYSIKNINRKIHCIFTLRLEKISNNIKLEEPKGTCRKYRQARGMLKDQES
jgi:hypothetical protein